MSLRNWNGLTGGIIGRPLIPSAEDRIKVLLRIGEQRKQQEEQEKQRQMPVPTSAKDSTRYHTPANDGAEEARRLRAIRKRELVGNRGNRGNSRCPTPVAGANPTMDLIVTLSPDEDGVVDLDGSFWCEELEPFYEPTDEVRERPYRLMFRLLAMTYLNNVVYRNTDRIGDMRLPYIQTDESGTALDEVVDAVLTDVKTEDDWKSMFEIFEQTKSNALKVHESTVSNQTVLTFTFVRATLDKWIVKNLADLRAKADESTFSDEEDEED